MSELDDSHAADALREWGHALERLHEALCRDPTADSIVLDACIQRFEFCVELTWKVLKKILEFEGEQAKTPKQALQKAYAIEWIDDEALWLNMLRDRNLTSHTYKERLAQEIYARIPAYYAIMRPLHTFLVARYEKPH